MVFEKQAHADEAVHRLDGSTVDGRVMKVQGRGFAFFTSKKKAPVVVASAMRAKKATVAAAAAAAAAPAASRRPKQPGRGRRRGEARPKPQTLDELNKDLDTYMGQTM